MATDGIARADLDACLRVIAAAEALAPEHPDAVAVRQATASLFKTVKERRRAERRAAVLAADAALTASTATGARERIDDDDALLSEMGGVLDSLYAHFAREAARARPPAGAK